MSDTESEISSSSSSISNLSIRGQSQPQQTSQQQSSRASPIPPSSSSEKKPKRSKKVSKISAYNDEIGIIYLNVGGTLFATTKETLTKDANCMLGAMFSGNYSPSRRDYNGAYFIDRDAKHFGTILNFLRDGSVELSEHEHELRQLHREASFFQVQGLLRQIEQALEHIQKSRDGTGEYAVAYLGGYGKSAQIYTKDTGGGFSSSCITLNKLAAEGYHIEGVASGAEGHYYAILRTDKANSELIKKTKNLITS
jgi:hypothetical protein